MLIGNISEPLRSLLEFESQRLGLPISYTRVPLQAAPADPAFRPELLVYCHTDRDPLPFAIPVGDELIKLRSSVYAHEVGEAVGPEIDGETQPLCFIDGRRLLIPFDLERMDNLNGVNNPINKIWTQISELALPLVVDYIRNYDWREEKQRYARIKLAALEMSIKQMERDVSENRYQIDIKTSEIGSLVDKNSNLEESIDLLQTVGVVRREENAIREFQSLMKLAPKPYSKIDFTEYSLAAETVPIEIEYEGNYYELGRFHVEIIFERDRLVITNLIDDAIVEGYHHPHVDSSGSPCLGNISVSLTKLLALKQYPAALSIIYQYLNTYNADNPYLRIERWDPDWEESKDYQDCYENASSRECVECDDNECPNWDYRFQNCQEFSELERCLSCKECSQWENEVDHCRESSAPASCINCSQSECNYAGDEDACYDDHDGADCADCQNTNCSNYKEDEDND